MEFRRLRNEVNCQRKVGRANYYANSVRHLRQSKPSAWWNEVKRLSGMNVLDDNSEQIVKSLKPNESCNQAVKKDLANEINKTFITPMLKFEPLSMDRETLLSGMHNRSVPPVSMVTSTDVFRMLSKCNPRKAHGPVDTIVVTQRKC